MHLTVDREEVIRLATTMGYKYKASESTTTGGCKAGICYDYKAPDALDVLRRFIIAMAPYCNAGVSLGGDLGVDYGDVLNIFDEIGIGLPQTKAMREDPEIQKNIKIHDEVCDMTYDGFTMYDMITGYGVAAGTDEAWKIKGGKPGATVVVQGFGCVGASLCNSLDKMGYIITGIADANALYYNPDGLDVKKLIATRKPKGEVDPEAALGAQVLSNEKWLEMPVDIIIPAALQDVINKDNAHLIQASLISEAANIPTTPEADEILKEKGIDVCVDFVTNLGGIRIYDVVIFGLVPPVPEEIVKDTETLIRKNIRLLFEQSKKTGRYTRDLAYEIFAPDKSDYPDY